ncbi:TetR/AcrR family transcriptional regulator [Antrihabitans sp. YC2-6]|nr:TetR/AcrR family transcriptional regulator [Antrihabitans sp. YC2-6]
MLTSAVQLIRERGVAGATIDAILSHSNAPRGSVYYHFPGGRTQIITEAIDFAGTWITSIIERATTAADTRLVLRGFIETWKKILRASNFDAGCPIVAVAVDGMAEDPALRAPAAAIFGQWRDALSVHLVADGVDEARAARLASVVIASIEGAVVLCRVEQSTDPLDHVGQELEELLATVLAK